MPGEDVRAVAAGVVDERRDRGAVHDSQEVQRVRGRVELGDVHAVFLWHVDADPEEPHDRHLIHR